MQIYLDFKTRQVALVTASLLDMWYVYRDKYVRDPNANMFLPLEKKGHQDPDWLEFELWSAEEKVGRLVSMLRRYSAEQSVTLYDFADKAHWREDFSKIGEVLALLEQSGEVLCSAHAWLGTAEE